MRGRAIWLVLVAMVACTPSAPPDVDTRRVRGSSPPIASTDAPAPEDATPEVADPGTDVADSTAPGEVPDRWSYPPLDLVAGLDEDGSVLVGPRAFAGSGCGRLDAELDEPTTVVVHGMRSPGGSVACTADRPPRWFPVRVQEPITLAVAYRGRTGSYELVHSENDLTMELVTGEDTAPPLSGGWWRIPSDFRSVQTYASADGAGFCARVSERFRREGAVRFEAPEGQPLLRYHGRAPYISASERSWYLDSQERDWCLRSIRISASDERLKQIAEEEASRQPCSLVTIWRSSQEAVVHAQGVNSRCGPPPTPQPTPLI